MGHMPDYQKINPERLLFGRYINELDMERKRKVCLTAQRYSWEPW